MNRQQWWRLKCVFRSVKTWNQLLTADKYKELMYRHIGLHNLKAGDCEYYKDISKEGNDAFQRVK